MNEQRDEAIKIEIRDNPIVILYFENQSCGACQIIRGRVGQILGSYPKVKIIDIKGDKHPKLAAYYQVFAAPLLILFVEGKEVVRLGRYLDFFELEKMIHRYYEMLF